MDLDKLNKFFEERPSLNKSGIEREAGLPSNVLEKILRQDRALTDTYITRLLPVLKKYGYK